MSKKKDFYKQKTFWSALTMIASGVLPLFGIATEPVTMILGGLTAIFLRQGIENAKE